MSFQNKVVLVTGSGSGIGQGTAILFAEEGASIVIVDLNEEKANETATKCNETGTRVLVIKADVSKPEEAKKALEKTIGEFGKLDVLVNNAGIVRQGNLLSGTIMDTCDEIWNTNLRSVILMTSLATPHLIKTKGCIVNTSSMVSKLEQKGSVYPVYCVCKAGVDSFTRLSAIELAPKGIRVNAVNPGPVNTNLLTNAGINETFEMFEDLAALKKNCMPREVADLILYLSSDKAKSITGSTYVIDNGMSII